MRILWYCHWWTSSSHTFWLSHNEPFILLCLVVRTLPVMMRRHDDTQALLIEASLELLVYPLSWIKDTLSVRDRCEADRLMRSTSESTRHVMPLYYSDARLERRWSLTKSSASILDIALLFSSLESIRYKQRSGSEGSYLCRIGTRFDRWRDTMNPPRVTMHICPGEGFVTYLIRNVATLNGKFGRLPQSCYSVTRGRDVAEKNSIKLGAKIVKYPWIFRSRSRI